MANTVLISNLPVTIDASALEDMFMSVGNVLRAHVAPSGTGHVDMLTPEEAQNCVLHFHGQNRDGKTLVVREDKPHVPQPRPLKKKRGSK